MVEQRLRLGQLLVDASIISQEQLEEVLQVQKQDGRKLGTLLVERGFINETQLTQILSQQLSVPWVSLYHVDFSKRLLSLVPRDVADKFCLVPIYVRHVRGQGDTLYVAMDDPTNDEALKACSMWSGLPTRAMIASPTDIRDAIRVYYGDGRRASVPPPAEDKTDGAAPERAEKAPHAPPVQTAAEKQPAAAPEPAPAPVADADPPRPMAESIPPAPESAAAWKAPGVKLEAWSPDDKEFSAGAAEPVADKTAGPDQPAASAPERPADETLVQAAPSAPEPATDPTVSREQGPAEAQAAAAPDRAAGAKALDAGTLDEQPAPSADDQANKEDQVTLEVGEEIPLEALLPEGKAMPRKRPMTGAERLMSLTLLDGTRLALPVRRLKKPTEAAEEPAARPPSSPPPSERSAPVSSAPRSSRPPHRVSHPPAEIKPEVTYSARDLIAALRASAHGVDATELIGQQPKWEAILAALVALMLRRGLLDEQELIDEINKI